MALTLSPKKRMCSKETMIDTRPGTSTVGVQCSIWDRSPMAPAIENAVQEINATVNKLKHDLVHASMNDAEMLAAADNVSDRSANGGTVDNVVNEAPVRQQPSIHVDGAKRQLLEGSLLNQCNTHDVGRTRDTAGNSSTQETRKRKLKPDMLELNTPNIRKRCLSLDDESYELMVDILTGHFNVPVKERTRKQKAVFVRLWRNKGKYTIDDDTPQNLYFDGKRVLRRYEIRALVSTYQGATGKTTGARKIQQSLRQAFDGISRKAVVKVIKETEEKGNQRQFYV